MTQQGTEYNVDIVIAIDGTGSMGPYIDGTKARAARFASDLQAKMREKGRSIRQLRVRGIVFRDFAADGDAVFEKQAGFVDITNDASPFADFLAPVTAFGGGDEPENAFEALNLAIRSDWNDDPGARARRVIVMHTDASPHPLERGRELGHHNGEDYAGTLDELTDLWDDMPPASRRLLLYAPEHPLWSQVGDHWQQTVWFPSAAGEGLQDQDYDAILDALANSIVVEAQ